MKAANKLCLPAMAVSLLVWGVGHAKADALFDLTWSGALFGNTATAVGTIALNLAAINNPGGNGGFNVQSTTPFVTNFSITITGAASGNGTFDFGDFNGADVAGGFDLRTGGRTLDFTKQLFGQPTPGGPWGSTQDAATGDFDIFSNGSNLAAPTAIGFSILGTEGGQPGADALVLTSFAPAVAVPEPSAAAPIAAALLVLAVAARRRIHLPIR